jgi:hypothetical protein
MRVALPILLVVASFALASPARAQGTNTFLFPTGDLVPRGEGQWQGQMLAAYNTVSYGVSDHIELSAALPVVPLFAQAHARAGLTGRDSPLRLVVGAGGVAAFGNGAVELGAIGSATAAVRGPRFNLHATISVLLSAGLDGGVGVVTSGGLARIAEHTWLGLDWARVSVRDGMDFSVANMYVASVKVIAEKAILDLGLWYMPDLVEVPLPALSLSYRL